MTATASASGEGSSDGAGGAATLPGGAFSIGASAPISPVFIGLLGGLALCTQGLAFLTRVFPDTGACAPSPNGTNGPLSFNGTTGSAALLASAYLTGLINAMGTSRIFTGIALPAVGAGGTSAFSAFGGLLTATLTGNPWTVGSVTQTGAFDGVTASLTAAGFDARDASGQGLLQLVTGADIGLIYTTNEVATIGNTPLLGVLAVRFVPEPGTALLFGSGVLAVCVAGRRRKRG